MANYLKKFNLHEQYNSFLGGGEFVRPNVSLVTDDGTVYYNPQMVVFYLDGFKFEVLPGTSYRQFFEDLTINDSFTLGEVTYIIWLYDEKIRSETSDKSDIKLIDKNLETIIPDTIIKNNDIVYLNGDTPFYIDDNYVPVYTINGMTFGEMFEWTSIVNNYSQCADWNIRFSCGYNGDGSDNDVFIVNQEGDENCFFTQFYKTRLKNEDGTNVQCDDIIVKNANYYFDYENQELI